MWSICTDVCAEISDNFHTNFHYTRIWWHFGEKTSKKPLWKPSTQPTQQLSITHSSDHKAHSHFVLIATAVQKSTVNRRHNLFKCGHSTVCPELSRRMLNCASCCQNIAELLTRSSINFSLLPILFSCYFFFFFLLTGKLWLAHIKSVQ